MILLYLCLYCIELTYCIMYICIFTTTGSAESESKFREMAGQGYNDMEM